MTGPGRPQEDRIRRRRWFVCLLAFIALAGPSASHADARGAPEVRAISFVNSPVRGDTYERGEKIEVMVRFNRSVRLIETTLKLALTVGVRTRYAKFYAVRVEDGVERDLFFYYTVRADDRDADGISVPGGALLLEEGTVRALASSNIDADLTHGTVAADARRKVDGGRVTAPRISQVNMFPYAHGDEVHGRTIERDQHIIVIVEFDRAVRVTGTPRVALTIGTETRWASFLATAPWSDLYPESTVSFCYTVQREDHAPDGISIPADALSLNGGAITLAGDVETDAVLSHRAYDHAYWGVDGGSAAQGGRPQSDSTASEMSTEACDRHLRFA